MGRLQFRPLVTLALLMTLLGAREATPEDEGVKIFSQHAQRTASIRFIGHLHTGDRELAGAGSGFLIGRETIVTAAHLLPNQANYKHTEIEVRMGSLTSDVTGATVLTADAESDLAILTLSKPFDGDCPVQFSARGFADGTVKPGSTIYALGFPLDKDLSIARGVLSNTNDPSGQWQTDLSLNVGNSGGPIFDSAGRYVGIAVRRTSGWLIGDKEISVSGVSYFVPTDTLLASRALAFPTEDAAGCWAWRLPSGSSASNVAKFELPERINREHQVSVTKDDHPDLFSENSRYYVERFEADTGYSITGCNLQEFSANNAHDVACNILQDGKGAELSFRLTSGPAYDRWRGWYTARVLLMQKRLETVSR